VRFRYLRIFLSDFVLAPLLMLGLFNAELVVYGLRMGKGQLTIVWNARPFGEVYADPAVSDSVKAQLHLIDEIKQFAYDSIGLKYSDNYTTFFDQKGQRLMYVVTGAERFKLEAYTWNFPVVGEVPYKGFFEEKKAKEEYYRLRMLGLDANIGGAAGWSTLGWFRDPVLSSMLQYDEANLAELIIHELTHGTLFVKDSVDYNENLAQFVGVEGAKWFLRSKYGADSEELRAYLTSMEEDERKTTFMLEQAEFLGSVYSSFEAAMADQEKEMLKRKTFLLIWQRAHDLVLKSDPAFADRVLDRMTRSGNTMFLQYTRYEGKRDDFSAEFSRSGNDLRLFVKNMVVKYGA
jgi:predicted aminopeptidase